MHSLIPPQYRTAIAFTFCLLAFSACGVKGPPVSPVRTSKVLEEEESKAIVFCSVYDEDCDQEDKNYVAGLDPEDPKDAVLIKKLDASRKKKFLAEQAKKKKRKTTKPSSKRSDKE